MMVAEGPGPTWRSLGACLALGGVLALWIDLGDFHRRQTSDSLIPVLSSLYRWTPYYWDCNRIGMLVPLLAAPWQDPLTNLLLQAWLVLFATFAAFVLLPYYVLRNANAAFAGLLAAAFFFLLLSKDWSFYFTFGQPHYPLALALGLGALLLTAARPAGLQLVLAAALALLAHWVNAGTVLFLGPLVVLRWLLSGGRRGAREAVLALGVLGIGAAAGALLSRLLAPGLADPLRSGLLPPRCWPEAWAQLAAGTWAAVVAPRGSWYLALAGAAAVGLVVPALRRQAAGPVRAALVLAGAAAVYGLATGTLQWVEGNSFHCRYWLPAVFFLQAALAILVAGPPAALLRGPARRLAVAGSATGLLLGVALVFGPPSVARVRADLDQLPHDVPLPRRTADLLATRASHVVGPYAQVWVAVFHANLALHERGEARVVWGVSGRALPTWDIWGRFSPENLRVAVLPEHGAPDREAAAYRACCLPPLTAVERRPTLELFRPSEMVRHTRSKAGAGNLVALAWHSGFSSFPTVQGVDWRWGDASAKLDVCNFSDRAQTVTLEMRLTTASGRPARLCLDGDLFDDELCLAGPPQPYTRTVAVPPGRHVVAFGCDGPAVRVPGMSARFVFCVTHVRLTQEPSETSAVARAAAGVR
jgi:hypothetical protein